MVKVAKAQGKEDEKGGTWLQGSVRRIRYQKGSKRPPIIWPEIWKLASLSDRTKYRQLWARALLEQMALRETATQRERIAMSIHDRRPHQMIHAGAALIFLTKLEALQKPDRCLILIGCDSDTMLARGNVDSAGCKIVRIPKGSIPVIEPAAVRAVTIEGRTVLWGVLKAMNGLKDKSPKPMTGGRKRQEAQLKGWGKIRALAEMVLRSGGVVVFQVHPDANIWSCQNLGQWCQKWGMCKVTTWASRWGATKEEQCWKFMASDQHLAQIMAGPAETLSMPTRAQRGDRKLKSVYSLSFAAEVHRAFRAMALGHVGATSSTEQYLKQNQSQRAMQPKTTPVQTVIEATASPISESRSVDEGWVMAALYSSASDDENLIEIESAEKQHSEDEVHVPGAVARPVGKGEIAKSPEAQEALKKEWTRLEKLGPGTSTK